MADDNYHLLAQSNQYANVNDDDAARILCCMCAVPVAPNPAGMCMHCISARTDITEGIPRTAVLHYCRKCERYLQPPAQWLRVALESRELMAMCVRRLRGLSRVRLVDAVFLWSEPNSRRVRIKLTVQKEVFARAVLQQSFVVEYCVCAVQCPDCARTMANQTWRAVVQLRQRVPHKRTFLYLEQVMLRLGLHRDAVSLKDRRDGLDFRFANRNHASRFVDAVRAHVPIRSMCSGQLISADEQNSDANMRHAYSVEIAALCREDLVVMTPRQMQRLGLRSPLALCTRVRSNITLFDPETHTTATLTAAQYFEDPPECIAGACASPASSSSSSASANSSERSDGIGGDAGNGESIALLYSGMCEFLVLDVEPTGLRTGKHVQALVTVRGDSGAAADEYIVRSHLGAVLCPGDTVRGYHVGHSNVNSETLDLWREKGNLPDVVLVQKTYQKRRNARRQWHLRALDEVDQHGDGRSGGAGAGNASSNLGVHASAADRERFMRDLEEDAELRANIMMFKNHDANAPRKRPSNRRHMRSKQAPSAGAHPGELSEIAEEEEEEEQEQMVMEMEIEENNATLSSGMARSQYSKEQSKPSNPFAHSGFREEFEEGDDQQEAQVELHSSEQEEGDGEFAPEVPLEELLEALVIDDSEGAESNSIRTAAQPTFANTTLYPQFAAQSTSNQP